IPLAMMLLEPGAGDGRWLLGALDVEAFGGVLRAHEVGEHGVASILTRDGMLIARSDSGTRHAGLDAAGSPVFQALAGAPGGVVWSRSRLEGVALVVGYRRGGRLLLVATLS